MDAIAKIFAGERNALATKVELRFEFGIAFRCHLDFLVLIYGNRHDESAQTHRNELIESLTLIAFRISSLCERTIMIKANEETRGEQLSLQPPYRAK